MKIIHVVFEFGNINKLKETLYRVSYFNIYIRLFILVINPLLIKEVIDLDTEGLGNDSFLDISVILLYS